MAKRKLLEEVIANQVVVEFTGKINLLSDTDYASLGYIAMNNGRIIDAKFNNKIGERAYISSMIHQEKIRVVVEAEKIDYPPVIEKSFRDLIESFEEAYLEHKYYEYFTVPKDVELRVNPEFLRRGSDMSRDEFAILLTLNKHGKQALFTDLNLLDYEITKNLISLRKKHALITTKKVRTKELRV